MVVMNRFSVGYMQTGKEELENDNKRYWVPRPLTDKGINGEGQIVGVLDSGVDIHHNFFYDSEHKFEYDKFDDSQRKVVYYETTGGDNSDLEEGHGTHVCGTLLDKSWKNNSEASLYDGVAPEAKLFFVDIGKKDNYAEVKPVDDEDIANRAVNKGVGILSRSYGEVVPAKSLSYIENKLALDHKDLLVVVCAHNFGPDINVGATGDAVNVLTVGCVYSPSTQGIDWHPDSYGVFTLTNKDDQNQKVSLTALSSVIGVPSTKEGGLLDVDDLNVSETPSANAICLIPDKGNASIEAELKRAEEEHCAFAVVENNTYKIEYTFPTYTCSSEPFETLREFHHASYKAKSTIGEVYTGVLKPDVAAPGAIITSVKSAGFDSKPTNDTSYNTLTMIGATSMATPIISGCATLFRQYFMQGWYPSCNRTKEDGFEPLSSLLKAALINSANSKRDNGIGHGIPILQLGMGFDEYGVMFVDDQKIKPKKDKCYKRRTVIYHIIIP